MDTDSFLSLLKTQSFYVDQICHVEVLPARSARHGSLAKPLPQLLQDSLIKHHLYKLFSHQAEAVNRIREGKQVIIATSSASGKSLCYNIAIMEAMIAEPRAVALYLFPTKALAQDQLGKLTQYFTPEILEETDYATYDGDTPQRERAGIRRKTRLILTNPDMLHVNLLPNHAAWTRMWRNLRYVVVDEAHAYRGVFGSHVALILRRLRRLCQAYGATPQFILASATIENPGEHAANLVGMPFNVINNDGSPKGGKESIFWDPPMIDPLKGSRRSANIEAANIMSLLVSEDVRSLCFTRTRRLTELVANYIRDRLKAINRAYVSRVKSYRAGYLAEERRQIEKELFTGKLTGVVATNALELGVDIGDLDATVLTGYPGSIASTWQQAGRSGRRHGRSLSFLVGLDNPLDQYLINHPDFFFGHSFEHALTNPQNHHILRAHLLCAVWELALRPVDDIFFGKGLNAEIAGLCAEGRLREKKERFYLSPALAYPAGEVDIRSATGDHFTMIDSVTGHLLETLDAAHAFMQAHLGAVYLHQGETYVVQEFDIASKIIRAKTEEVNYYTVVKDLTDLRILSTREVKNFGQIKVYLGEVEVTTEIISYKKKAQLTEEIIGEVPLDLPAQRFRTVAVWFDLPANAENIIIKTGRDWPGALHAAEHATIGLLPLFTMCDRNDIGGVSTPLHPDTGQAQIFLYDSYPGGVGIAEKGFDLIRELWQATLTAIIDCPCEEGCPSCIQSPKCGNNNKPLDKQAAKTLLAGLLASHQENS
jgi:DEAD/DEAH box helicase domain-containing protein